MVPDAESYGSRGLPGFDCLGDCTHIVYQRSSYGWYWRVLQHYLDRVCKYPIYLG